MTYIFDAGNDDNNEGENASDDGNETNDWVEESRENATTAWIGKVLGSRKHVFKVGLKGIELSVGKMGI